MKSIFKLAREDSIYFFLGLILFIYLFIRAIYVPFTHDEASTFFRFVQPHKLAPEFSREALNNHFINTLLTYLSYLIFGSSKIALRLPNLLISIVYIIFVYKLARFLIISFYRWGFIIMMLFAHFFIEFFAVSRGYGMSIAFFMAVFYYLLKAISTEKVINHVYVSMFSLLMVAANINMVIPSIAILLLQIFSIVFHKKKLSTKQKWMIPLFLFISMITIFAAFLYLNKLREYDAFYLVPENEGFIESTLVTLMDMLAGGTGIFNFIVLFVLFALVIFIASVKLFRQKLKFLTSINSAFLFVLAASVIGIVLVVNFFGVNYPEDRAAIYLFPLAIGSLFFVFDSVRNNKYRYLYLFLLPLLFFPIHFVSSINVSYVNGYKIEALPERFYQIISTEHNKNNEIPTIGGSNMRQFSWAYINYMNGGNENSIDWAGYPDTVSFFQILESKNYPYSLNNYDSVDYTPFSNLTLYKRKQQISKRKVEEKLIPESKNVVGNEYFNLLEIDVDTAALKNYFFEFNLDVAATKKPFTGWLVIQAVNGKNSTLVYKYIPTNWLKQESPGVNYQLHQSLFLGYLPEDVKMIKIYIWNKDLMTYTLNFAKVEVFEFE